VSVNVNVSAHHPPDPTAPSRVMPWRNGIPCAIPRSATSA